MGIKKIVSNQWKTLVEPLKEGKDAATQLKSSLRSVVRQLRTNRDPNAEGAPDLEVFQEVLDHWEISYEQIPRVVKGLKMRMILFAALGFYGIYLSATAVFAHKLFLFVSGLALVALGVISLLTGAWRIQVLKQKKFVFFKPWLINLLFGEDQED